jgi:uncharacterized heparinase superfamily protein
MKFTWRITGLRYRLERLTVRRLVHAACRLLFMRAAYGYTLGGRLIDALAFTPSDMWPGDANRGSTITSGDFDFLGRLVRAPEQPWHPVGVSAEWRTMAHGFGWLRDLRAAGGEASRERARELVLDWIDTEGRWSPVPWRPHVIAQRLGNWLGQSEFLCAGADEAFRERFLDSLARQARHLARVARFADPGARRIKVLKGLIYASLSLPGRARPLRRALKGLEAEIGGQVLGDGGHVERCPALQLSVLQDLVDIREALRDAQAEIPAALQTGIDRMAPMLRFFRHGDGGLALFNDTDEHEGWLIDVVLTRADARGKPLDSAPHAGFERLTANRTLLIVDTGRPPPPGLDFHAHAGTLSFEMSVGKERLVVNCGAHADDGADWTAAQRATAAHSTVNVEDVNSAELLTTGYLGHRPGTVTVERRDADGSCWVDASHDGYDASMGLVHHRRLFLAAGGGDLRGEDTLKGSGNHKFTVRFHLHPTVKASLVQQGSAVLLRLADGTGWRLRAAGGVTSLEKSVYLGIRGEVRRTEQVVISGATQNGKGQIKWAFSRLTDNC